MALATFFDKLILSNVRFAANQTVEDAMTSSEPQDAEASVDMSKCAQYLKALGDPIRLKMIRALQSGPKSVSDLSELLEVELANVSHHLRVLYHAGVVETEREGKFIYYSLSREIFHPKSKASAKLFDFGCCKLDLPGNS